MDSYVNVRYSSITSNIVYPMSFISLVASFSVTYIWNEYNGNACIHINWIHKIDYTIKALYHDLNKRIFSLIHNLTYNVETF